jgi:hypothetical protein
MAMSASLSIEDDVGGLVIADGDSDACRQCHLLTADQHWFPQRVEPRRVSELTT